MFSVSTVLAPSHLLIFGTLLGTQIHHSFIVVKVCFQTLPMPQFTTLQKRIFPIYFRTQTLLVLALAATYPPASVVSLALNWTEAIPVAISLVTSLLNTFVYGPKAQDAMVDRIHQETKDGRKYNDLDNQTDEMKAVNRRFSRYHAMCIHLNLIGIGATAWYGIVLGSKLNFGN